MYQALYRVKRPEVFSEILGQEHIVKILRYQVKTDSVSHAYLFCGTRGTGKTTTARILAKALNCTSHTEDKPCGLCPSCLAIKEGNFMDVVEIDAASNNGVENIRELRESVKYPPAVGRKKVYIIDEAHMLSTGASNALLKTLEEPPENVIFILATTEPNKLPQTILSRCMKLDFKRVPYNEIAQYMKDICDEREVEITEDALNLLARASDGSVRDGMSVLDQVLASGEKTINRNLILEYMGTESEEFYIELTEKAVLGKLSAGLKLIEEAIYQGKESKELLKGWLSHYRNLMIAKFVDNPQDMLNLSDENIEALKKQASHITLGEINEGILLLSKLINEARWSARPRILLELALISLSNGMAKNLREGSLLANNHERVESQSKAKTPDCYEDETRPSVVSGKKAKPESTSNVELTANVDEKEKLQEENDLSKVTTTYIEGAEKSQGGADSLKNVTALEETDSNSDYDQMELNEIWERVCEAGEDGMGSFNLIRHATKLIFIGQSDFTLWANNEFTKKMLYEYRILIENLMADQLGRKLNMKVRVDGEKKQADDGKSLAEKISQSLNIDIEIK